MDKILAKFLKIITEILKHKQEYFNMDLHSQLAIP